MNLEELEPTVRKLDEFLRQDLGDFSIEDLEDRIEDLRSEIKRCETEIEAKKASLKGAEAFFKK